MAEVARPEMLSDDPADWVVRYGVPQPGKRRALFLDRDGTIIENIPYLNDPDRVTLIGGSIEAISAFRADGFAIVVLTNQSGIARGLCSRADYFAVEAQVQALLGEGLVDAVYACPFLPDGLPPFNRDHPWRKPCDGMLRAAAEDLNLDLATSIMVGDSLSDVEAGLRAGVSAVVHVLTGHGAKERDAVIAAFDSGQQGLGRSRLVLADRLGTLESAEFSR